MRWLFFFTLGERCNILVELPGRVQRDVLLTVAGIIIIIIIIVIIIILCISFMQGIYTDIPETNHVPREHCF
jgi:hypothetical protein